MTCLTIKKNYHKYIERPLHESSIEEKWSSLWSFYWYFGDSLVKN
jgi:hypothetical protein